MKRLRIAAFALLGLLALSACTPSSPASEGIAAIRVTDMKGREIVLSKPAQRVAALTASDCEILFALGAGDALVGRGEYCDYPAAVADIPAVQSGYETNIEQILDLKPDVLFMNAMDQPKEQVQILEDAGVTVVVSDADDIAQTYVSIRLIGAVMGRDAQAEALIDSMEATFAELSAAAAETERTIYFEVSPLEYGLWTAGGGTFMNEVSQMLGLTNIFADVDGWAEISQEQVIARDPDFIVTAAMYSGEGPTPEEEILSRPGWQEIAAVKNGAILNLRANELSRPGPRLADGAQALYDFVHAAEPAA